MAPSIKILLLEEGMGLGNGLAALRTLEDQLIDISEFEPGLSDATNTMNPGYIIKNNKVYRMLKNYFDLDKNMRVFICKSENEPYDRYPIPTEKK